MRCSIKGIPIEGEGKPGQLFKDIVYMYKENDFSKIRWAFDSRNTGNEENIRKLILKGVDKEKEIFARELNIEIDPGPDGISEWDDFLDRLDVGLKTMIEVIPD